MQEPLQILHNSLSYTLQKQKETVKIFLPIYVYEKQTDREPQFKFQHA